MLGYLILTIILRLTNAEKYFQIEDIPIENFSFEHEDLQSDAVDIELMPRRQRSFPTSNEDPKEYFFNRPFFEENNFDIARDVPRPGGFNAYSEDNQRGVRIRNKRENPKSLAGELHRTEAYSEESQDRGHGRNKREALQPLAVKLEGKEMKSIVKRLGKPLELVIINPERITEQPEDVSTDIPITDEGITESSNFLINDFIRFKRAAVPDRGEDVIRIKDMMKKIEDENKR